MPKLTDNYGLEKPLLQEEYDIEVFNQNADKLDHALREHAQQMEDQKLQHEEDVRNIEERADEMLEQIEQNKGEGDKGLRKIEADLKEHKDSADHDLRYYTQDEVDNKFSTLETNIDWKESVDTFEDIAATYPQPEDGWTVNVKDTDYTYRWTGEDWVVISANAIPIATKELDGKMSTEHVAELEDTAEKKHSHGNKSVIDTITQAMVNAWNKITEHIADTVSHVTSNDKTTWNNKVDTAGSALTKSGTTLNHNNYGTAGTYGPAGNVSTAGSSFAVPEITTNEQGHITAAAARTMTFPAGYTHPNSGAAAGTYRSVTVNAQGHVTAGTNPTTTVAQGGTGAADAATARTNLGVPPISHASTGTGYGIASASDYGHVKVSTGNGLGVSNGTIVMGAGSTTAAGAVQLNDTLTSTSTAQAATANSAKQLNDKITEINGNLDQKISNTGGVITGPLIIQGGTSVYKTGTASLDTSGYIQIATIKINKYHVNYPIFIEITQRSYILPMQLYIMFDNSEYADPGINTFRYTGNNFNAWLHKESTSTWKLYLKTNPWAGLDITELKIPGAIHGLIDVTFNNKLISALPDGCVSAYSLS